jgi:predicted GNAT family N-acyltransferase
LLPLLHTEQLLDPSKELKDRSDSRWYIGEVRIKELEWDEHDTKALHALVLNKLGQAVATGRLLQPQPKLAQIGRMAVSKPLRGGNLGRMVINALIDAARQRGDHDVILHAQCSAEGFYRRLGFKAHGDVFQDAGIDHIEMTLKLV